MAAPSVTTEVVASYRYEWSATGRGSGRGRAGARARARETRNHNQFEVRGRGRGTGCGCGCGRRFACQQQIKRQTHAQNGKQQRQRQRQRQQKQKRKKQKRKKKQLQQQQQKQDAASRQLWRPLRWLRRQRRLRNGDASNCSLLAWPPYALTRSLCRAAALSLSLCVCLLACQVAISHIEGVVHCCCCCPRGRALPLCRSPIAKRCSLLRFSLTHAVFVAPLGCLTSALSLSRSPNDDCCHFECTWGESKRGRARAGERESGSPQAQPSTIRNAKPKPQPQPQPKPNSENRNRSRSRSRKRAMPKAWAARKMRHTARKSTQQQQPQLIIISSIIVPIGGGRGQAAGRAAYLAAPCKFHLNFLFHSFRVIRIFFARLLFFCSCSHSF